MHTKLLLRFDDITPGMAWSGFEPLKTAIEAVGIKTILGVVPACRDTSLQVEPPRSEFFDLIRRYRAHGDTIAQHGTFHRYTTSEPGLLGINRRSEFAGLDYDTQRTLLLTGKTILDSEGVWEPYFMAPGHSFDDITVDALKSLGFVALTDGYGLFPYEYRNIKFIPQLTSSAFNIGFGYCTICVHVNAMTPVHIERLLAFAMRNRDRFIDFKEVVAADARSGVLPQLTRVTVRYALAGYRKMARGIRARVSKRSAQC
ncbi:MAG: DUF2334 domain-containing protein [Planctomycetia bacterium]